jgi:tetratricopeptide (TPR) repeat protein
LDDALAQYEECLARFPVDRFALNAKANLLIQMQRYEDALTLLPEREPQSRDDWFDLHVRGMAYLRRGEYATAVSIMERGVGACPFFGSASYFQNALAVAQLRQRQFGDALRTLSNDVGEIPDVLRLHAEAEQGHMTEASEVFQRLIGSQRRRVIDLRDELSAAFLTDGRTPKARTEEWYEGIYAREFDLVSLRMAA